MRTTLTLEPDVVSSLREVERRTRAGRKALINEALRRGLREIAQAESAPAAPYRTEPFDPGSPAVVGIHSVSDLLAFAEGEDFR